MTTNTNEMDAAAYVAAAPTTAADTMPTLPSDAITKDDGSPEEINMDVTVTNPVTNHDLTPDAVFVYANHITPVSGAADDTIVSFDVVFSVSVTDKATDTVSTHQVVKRIGVDKMKMANDAKMSTPISIVEAKKPKQPEEARLSAARIKALAGIK